MEGWLFLLLMLLLVFIGDRVVAFEISCFYVRLLLVGLNASRCTKVSALFFVVLE